MRLYNIKQVAEITGNKDTTVRYWARTGKIKAVKIGKEWKIPADEFERLFDQEHGLHTPEGEELDRLRAAVHYMPTRGDFAVHYGGRWISLAELIEYARKRGIDI